MLSKMETLTGISSLDSLIGNLTRDALIFIVGRPGMGKTALTMQIAKHWMQNNKKKTMIFSLEASERWLKQRLEKINNGPLPESHNIIIDDNPSLSVPEMQKICEKIDDLGIVIVDYLQLVIAERSNPCKRTRVEVIADACCELKAMSEKLQAPVVCVSQLHRACEYRVDKRPLLSDLWFCPEIESISDQVLFLYRDSYYNSDTFAPDRAECIVAKNTHGTLGTVAMRWNPETLSFEDYVKSFA